MARDAGFYSRRGMSDIINSIRTPQSTLKSRCRQFRRMPGDINAAGRRPTMPIGGRGAGCRRRARPGRRRALLLDFIFRT